jgi:hypothetical protein
MGLMARYLLITVLIAGSALAQAPDNPHSLTLGFGAAAFAGKFSEIDPGTALELNYGYRFTKYIQADIGFESSFNSDYRNYNPKFNTGLRTTTFFFVPAGGRLNIPLPYRDGRITPSIGVGAVYNYDSGPSFRATSYQHHGVGAYGLAGMSYAIDSRHHHSVGITLRYMNIMSVGDPHPQWWNVFGEYTYRWGLSR